MATTSYDTGPNSQPEKLSAPGQTTQPDSDAGSPPSFRELSHRTNAWELLWKEISWRFSFAVIWSVILIATLYAFAEMGNLSSWQKRWFNMISILLSALISLTLGSLLGLLGSTMRWPLLARNPNSPLDVDLILGMANPTGSAKLIWHHTKTWRWTTTTWIVTTYLLVNIIGRLSVALFGLTYDLNEEAVVDYPIMVTDWSTDEWFNISQNELVGTAEDFSVVNLNMGQLVNYAQIGLLTFPIPFDPTDSSSYNLRNINEEGLDREVDDNRVRYSYFLKEYRGEEEQSSRDRVLHSSASCIGRTRYEVDIYEDGEIVGTMDDDIPNRPTFVRVLEDISANIGENPDEYLWVARLDWDRISDPSACGTTYLYTNNPAFDGWEINPSYFECTTCLSQQSNNPGLELPGLSVENSSYAAGLLVRLGAVERLYESDVSVGIRIYPNIQQTAIHFVNGLKDTITGVRPHRSVAPSAELYAAHISARLPVLTVMGAETVLPKVLRDAEDREQSYINITLEVRWPRAIAVLVAIVAGQFAAIAVVSFWCRKVFIRDHDSYLSVARLLRTAMYQIEGRSMHTGEELATYLEKTGLSLRYGVRQREDGYEGDLWVDVSGDFPDGIYR